jgi:hypothetical protein
MRDLISLHENWRVRVEVFGEVDGAFHTFCYTHFDYVYCIEIGLFCTFFEAFMG